MKKNHLKMLTMMMTVAMLSTTVQVPLIAANQSDIANQEEGPLQESAGEGTGAPNLIQEESPAFLGTSGTDGDYKFNHDNYTGITKLTEYTGSGSGSLTVPSVLGGYPVDIIGSLAFHGKTGFDGDLTIPDENINEIDIGAFSECSGFKGNLYIGNNVKTIGTSAFRDCRGFTGDLTIPDSVTKIGDSAFAGCSGFDGGTLKIGDNVSKIGMNAFKDCRGLSNLILGERVKEIGYSAFAGCSHLKGDLIIGDSVEKLGYSVFTGCKGLDGNLKIGDGLEEIPSEVFKECSGIKKVEFGKNVATIGGWAFYKCTGLEGTLTIPDNVTTIKSDSFSGCKNITRVDNKSNAEVSLSNMSTGTGKKWFNETTGEEITGIANGVAIREDYKQGGESEDDVTVSFFTDGGTEVAVQTIKKGETAEKPADPVRDGYTFNGWYSDSSLTNAWDFSTPVERNTVLYAGWTKNSSEPDNPKEESKDASKDLKTLSVSSGKYMVTISMNSSIPSAKTKSEVLSKLNYTTVISTSDGSSCGIGMKKVKATKPKRGYTKVTFKLRGSGKEERKAVKVLNKSLKKIPIVVGS